MRAIAVARHGCHTSFLDPRNVSACGRWLHDYPVVRLTEVPSETHVHLLPNDDVPAGAGEPGVPPTIPALCNALFAATGKRLRQLPMQNTKLT